MTHKTKPSTKRDRLHFSVWDDTRKNGHALFVGDLFDTIHYLNSSDTTNLKVSVFDLQRVKSIVQVSAREWLNWYKQSIEA